MTDSSNRRIKSPWNGKIIDQPEVEYVKLNVFLGNDGNVRSVESPYADGIYKFLVFNEDGEVLDWDNKEQVFFVHMGSSAVEIRDQKKAKYGLVNVVLGNNGNIQSVKDTNKNKKIKFLVHNEYGQALRWDRENREYLVVSGKWNPTYRLVTEKINNEDLLRKKREDIVEEDNNVSHKIITKTQEEYYDNERRRILRMERKEKKRLLKELLEARERGEI